MNTKNKIVNPSPSEDLSKVTELNHVVSDLGATNQTPSQTPSQESSQESPPPSAPSSSNKSSEK